MVLLSLAEAKTTNTSSLNTFPKCSNISKNSILQQPPNIRLPRDGLEKE